MTTKKPKLTVKEAKLVKGIAQGKSKIQAAKDAGYAGSGVGLSVNTNKVLKRENVQTALQEALEKAGVTPDMVVAPVVQALTDDDLNMRLKGHDRAARIMQPVGEIPSVNINFNQVANKDRDEFGL